MILFRYLEHRLWLMQDAVDSDDFLTLTLLIVKILKRTD